MKESVTQKKCAVAEALVKPQNSAMKCITFMVFEEAGKTVLQPLVVGQDAHTTQKLFDNGILELWLPNGESGPSQFDVNILKYKQQTQPSKKCGIAKNMICLKNYFETIVSCDQCPVSSDGVHE